MILAAWVRSLLPDEGWREAREPVIAHVSLRPTMLPPRPTPEDLQAPEDGRASLPYVLLATPEGAGALTPRKVSR